MDGKVLRTVVDEDKIIHILFSQELSSNSLGNPSLLEGSQAVTVILRDVTILNHPLKGSVVLQLVPGLAHTEPCSEICGTRLILQITTAAGGRNMRKLIISTAAKMTSSISHGARIVSTMVSSMQESKAAEGWLLALECCPPGSLPAAGCALCPVSPQL